MQRMKLTASLLLLVSVALLMLASCTSSVRTKVTAFNSISVPVTGNAIIEPAQLYTSNAPGAVDNPADIKNSLEFKHYSRVTAAALAEHGIRVLEDDAEATPDYRIALGFYVEEVQPKRSRFQSGVVYRTSPWRYTGGEILLMNGDDKRREYRRTLTFSITRTADESRIYETTASSRGSCDVMTVVFDEMLAAVLTLYPQADGSVKSVTVKGDSRC